MHHPDVDAEGGTNGGAYQRVDLCPACYRLFVNWLTGWVGAEKKR